MMSRVMLSLSRCFHRRRNRQAIRSVLAFCLALAIFIYSVSGDFAVAQDAGNTKTSASDAQSAVTKQETTAVPTQTETSSADVAPNVAQVPVDDKAEKKVIAVEILGNQIISTQTILSKMRVRKGAILRQQTVNDDIKRLYAAGYFDDIQVKLDELPDGFKIFVTVVEKPVIKEITISGHTIFKDEKLRKTLGLVEGEVIDENKLTLPLK